MQRVLAAVLLAASLLATPRIAGAQYDIEVMIRKWQAERIPLAVAPFSALDGSEPGQALALEQIVVSDLEFSGVFKVQRGRVLVGAGSESGLVEVRGALLMHAGAVHFEGRVVDVGSGQQIGAKRYAFQPDQLRAIAHHFADEVVRMLTGEDGIATSRVLFRRKNGEHWEVVLSDYDGHNPRVLVRQTVPIMYPRWVDDDKALVYTSFRYGKPDLFLRTLREPSSSLIASYEGLNFSVDWSESRREMVATLSKDGNAEIYILAPDGKIRKRLTHSPAIEVSPTWSPSGREIMFTSDRVGEPHIFIMEADGSNVRRLTFAGNYNESPCWSPKGDYIAFVSRIDGFFQLCTIRPDGSNFTVLTDEPVNHEDPRWAPNGRHIIFTENRSGEPVISIIDIGTKGKRILARGENADWSSR